MLSPVESAERRFVVAVIRDLTNQNKLEKEVRQLASSDALTGVGNYRRLQEAVDTEAKWFWRNGRISALLLLDLDGLKAINDTHGT